MIKLILGLMTVYSVALGGSYEDTLDVLNGATIEPSYMQGSAAGYPGTNGGVTYDGGGAFTTFTGSSSYTTFPDGTSCFTTCTKFGCYTVCSR
jgi:hypothetical protein